MYCVTWSYNGGSYSRCFETPEERDHFVRVYLSPDWFIRKWERENEAGIS